MNDDIDSGKLTIERMNDTARGMKFSRDFIVYDECFLPTVFFKENILDFSGLVFVKSGKFSVTLNGIPLLAEAGQLLFFRCDDKVEDIMYTSDCKGWIFAVSGKLSRESMAAEGLSELYSLSAHGAVVNPPEKVSELIQLYGEILKVKYNSGMTDIVKTLRALFSDVYQGIKYSDGFNEDASKSAGNIYRRFLTLLGQTDPKPRKLGWYADRLGVTSKYLTTVSRKISGETAMYRIDEAILRDIGNALRHSEDTISTIASRMGFNNSSFFGKFVKKHSGMTPLRLRSYLRQKDNIMKK